MASTFSNLKFEIIGDGEQSGTWGTTTNTNIGTAIEQAIVGMATLEAADFTANVATLTLANTNAAQDARALCLNIASDAVSAAGTVNVPAIEKPYLIINGSSFTVTVKVSGQTGVAVPAGKRTVVYNNGTDVGSQINWLSALEAATLTTSGTVTLNGGTANGVAFLNGSKVLTTGSALTYNGSAMQLNAASFPALKFGDSGATLKGEIYYGIGGNDLNIVNYVNGPIGFSINSAEQMRLTSTGLGIGTSSPAAKLNVDSGSAGLMSVFDSTNANGGYFLGRSSGTVVWDFGTAKQTLNVGGATDLGINVRSGFMAFGTGTTERMRLDSSGNLGLGGTPSAWHVNFRAYQAGSSGYAAFVGDQSNGRAEVLNNCFASGASTYNYSQSLGATRYSQQLGSHVWYNAPPGTQGNAITFTQAMTLDASGNLLVGTTSPSANCKITVNGGVGIAGGRGTTHALNYADWLVYNSSTGNALVFDNGSERARINSSGNLLVGTTTDFNGDANWRQTINSTLHGLGIKTTGAAGSYLNQTNWHATTSGTPTFSEFATESTYTARGSITYNRGAGLVAYNTTSDYRAKDIIGPVENSGALIDSVPVYMGKMKGATQERPMFIAHEVPAYAHTGEKDAVDADGKPVYQQMDASALVPVMWAEIQSLRARVLALESN
jgi:hypothetical protein